VLKRLRLRLERRSLRKQRTRLWVEFAGSDVQNLDEFLRDYDRRITEIDTELAGS
jgi:hypothetical protein